MRLTFEFRWDTQGYHAPCLGVLTSQNTEKVVAHVSLREPVRSLSLTKKPRVRDVGFC